nr:receptor-like protein kinase 2 [Quercus suber]
MPILSIIGENSGLRSETEVSGDKTWLKTSNSSSESFTSTTSPSSELAVQDEVATLVTCCDNEALTFENIPMEIPKAIWNMTKLQQLSLDGNIFFATIPSSIMNLKGLKILELNDNSLSMEIPIDIGYLSNITSLVLSNKKSTGRIPSSMQKLTKLETIKLENNMLDGEI